MQNDKELPKKKEKKQLNLRLALKKKRKELKKKNLLQELSDKKLNASE